MKIYNRHERKMRASSDDVGSVLDSLSGPADGLWPAETWPPMKLDALLREGSQGGHGPVRYRVVEYWPGRRVMFEFAADGLTGGLDGRHFFEVVPRRDHTILRHVVDAECGLDTWVKWRLLIEPMHDALIEDAFDKAEKRLQGTLAGRKRWSLWVRILRGLRRRAAARVKQK
jgi:hypothetical protein